MNRILFSAEEVKNGHVELSDHRAAHIRNVLRARKGDTVKSGIINGLIGTSRVEIVTDDLVRLRVTHDEPAPEPWLDLILAAPRPKAMRRLWAPLASLGVGKIIILSAFRVERCYFSSHWLAPEHYTPLLVEGLMQAGVSRLPEVHIKQWFKPFIQDDLDEMFPDSMRLIAHPTEGEHNQMRKTRDWKRPLLAVGPEGGWSEYERQMFAEKNFEPYSLGGRTLNTTTATIALIAALMAQ
jgi:RsmE family RNA methyltransferase